MLSSDPVNPVTRRSARTVAFPIRRPVTELGEAMRGNLIWRRRATCGGHPSEGTRSMSEASSALFVRSVVRSEAVLNHAEIGLP